MEKRAFEQTMARFSMKRARHRFERRCVAEKKTEMKVNGREIQLNVRRIQLNGALFK